MNKFNLLKHTILPWWCLREDGADDGYFGSRKELPQVRCHPSCLHSCTWAAPPPITLSIAITPLPSPPCCRPTSRQGDNMDWGFFRRAWFRGRRTRRSLTFNSTYSYCHVFRGGGDYRRVSNWILNLLTPLRTTSNYNATADLHTSQFITASPEPSPAWCASTSRSLTATSNSVDSLATRGQVLLSQPPVRFPIPSTDNCRLPTPELSV
jgi:hypothetical protein